jgi:leader peptidase (prepilin peptidase)/N-methyltransferase
MGAVAGSFMNVCIYRLPKAESIITPGSYCPSCKQPIQWFDNIPLVSFVILRGRCRSCRSAISWRYFAAEALSGFFCTALFMKFGLSPEFFIYFYLTGALIVASFIDLRIYEIPDAITLPGIVIGVCVASAYPGLMGAEKNLHSFLSSLLGVFAGGGSMYALGFIGEFIFKREAMGGGDVKLLAMIGAFVGWKLALFTFFLAPFFGSVVGIILRLKEGKDIIPYGPYISLAAFVAIMYGKEILYRLFYI